MRKLIAITFFSLITIGSLFSQNHYTISYRSSFYTDDSLAANRPFNPFVLAVRDSVAYCYYPSALAGRKMEVPVPLGSNYWPKSTFYDSDKGISIYSTGHYDKPKQWRLIEQKMNKIKWDITEEKKEILGFICYKAIGKTRDKNYVAWFSMELKGSFGPFIMTDLPGTILQLQHGDGLFSVAYEIKDESLPIVEPNYCKKIRSW